MIAGHCLVEVGFGETGTHGVLAQDEAGTIGGYRDHEQLDVPRRPSVPSGFVTADIPLHPGA
ncbi:hypothetical protein GR168_21100 [Gordonia sp. JH63]|uniref:hypothetical protein n=1 Tax=Gordonia sp. JH63 TaxID=2698900 RepID=UPI00132009BA|nr:hypothetical protein [Gordonia sp. JH63]QHD87604.1 hypothetical protein GR168_21100 [Gordonia sp. JH63]